MRNRKLFWFFAFAVAAAGFASGSLIDHEYLQSPGKAVWKEVYSSPQEMAARVDAIGLFRVESTRPGRVVTSANGEDVLPFQRVELTVVRPLKGLAAGKRIELERAGGTTPDGRHLDLQHDGGAFEPGATYLLFLRRQPGSSAFYQVNHQARFLVADGRVWAADPDDAVAMALEGRPVREALGLVERSVRSSR